MKIPDLLPQLTILPLRRFADAWSVKAIKGDSQVVYEQAILDDAARISSEPAVRDRLSAFERGLDYRAFAKADAVLRLVLDEPGYALDESAVVSRAVGADKSFAEYAGSKNAIQHLDQRTVDIYQSVLQVAYEDKLSFDEYQLVKHLQRKLGINRRDHRVLEARAVGGTPISPQDADQAIKDLASYGLVCRFRHLVVCPEEIAVVLRAILGISLQAGAYRNLAMKVPVTVIKQALEAAGQPVAGVRKDTLIDRLIDGEVPPALLLEQLTSDALDELLRNFPNEKTPAHRAVKIRHIVSLFERFASASSGVPADDPNKTYFAYLVELAARRYEALHAANVIRTEKDVDRAFERGVQYAFSELLGHAPLGFQGSDHADGGTEPENGRMILWDCKSALEPYPLTEKQTNQFLKYVAAAAPNRVSPFIIISHQFSPEAPSRALTLKAICRPGTEIALMTATDLKWLAEMWQRDYPSRKLPLDVLAHTGLLNRPEIEFRLAAFAQQAQDRESAK